MIKAYRKDLSKYIVEDAKGRLCKLEGYGEHLVGYKAIYVDENDSPEVQRLTAIHEVLELHLGKRVRHSLIDQIVIDIVDTLLQLDFIK